MCVFEQVLCYAFVLFVASVRYLPGAALHVVMCTVHVDIPRLIRRRSIPLLADITKKIASDYHVLVGEGDAEAGVALRGLFIIDPKGVVRQETINDLPVGRSVDEVLRLVKAFQ